MYLRARRRVRWRTELISHLEILFLRTAVSRLTRLGSWQTHRTPTRVSVCLLPLTGETFHLREGGLGVSSYEIRGHNSTFSF